MKDVKQESKITVACPAGHRLRGDAKLIGKTVKCPKCSAEFIFASKREQSGKENSTVTDTGVMRILGDLSSLPPMPTRHVMKTRPCTRCGCSISEALAVCNHCNCYVGVMPSYMKQIGQSENQSN